MAAILELEGITKRFPGILANDHISLSLEEGEIHALLGENGAGKTTLMNILYGLYSPDEGRILVRGQDSHIRSPGDAIRAGIGMVHQHFMLIPVFTVTENVMLGDEATTLGGVLDHKTVAKRILEISGAYNLEVDPSALVSTLAVGVQQRVEIIKLLYREAEHPDLRRADVGAHPSGSGSALPHHALAGGERQVDHLHHAQAARGDRCGGPHHGHPPGPGDRYHDAA